MTRLHALFRTFLIVAASLTVLFTAFNPASVLNALTSRKGLQITPSLAYDSGKRNTLDVYKPDGAHDAPVVVFFYGGSWQGGDKSTYRFVAAALARHGFVVMVPEYRVYPEVRFPDFLADGAKAVKWAAQNAVRFGGGPGKLFLLGHSAGAHIAAMLTFDGQWLGKENLDPRRHIAGFIGLAGPYDFLPLTDPKLQTIFGGPSVPETQPINFVAGGEPPVLLATGKRDRSVNPGNSARLAARLRREGGEATHIVYPYVSHLSLIAAFAPLAKLLAPVEHDVAAFVQRVAGAQPR